MKRIIFGIIGLVALVALSWSFFGGKEKQVGTLSELPNPSGLSDGASMRNRELLELSSILDRISFDTNKAIFSSKSYLSLQDFNQALTIDPNEVGRPNPFSVIGVDVGRVSAPLNTSSGDDLLTSRLVTKSSVNHSGTQAVLQGELLSGTAEVWIEWGEGQTSLTNLTPKTTLSSPGVFTKTINGLSAGTTYYYRAAATISGLTVYGTVLSFTQ